MPTGEKLFKFLAGLMLRKFYGTVIIRFENGKVTHVETETRRMWRYKDLPDEVSAGEWCEEGPAVEAKRPIVGATEIDFEGRAQSSGGNDVTDQADVS